MAATPVRTGERPNSALKAIKMMCIECMGGEKREVPHCTAPNCPLYDYRLGRKPKATSDKPKRVMSEETKQKMAAARTAKKEKNQ